MVPHSDDSHYLASDGNYYPVEQMPQRPSSKEASKQPLHKRWWFWFALVGLLLVAKWMNGPDFQAFMNSAESSFWRAF